MQLSENSTIMCISFTCVLYLKFSSCLYSALLFFAKLVNCSFCFWPPHVHFVSALQWRWFFFFFSKAISSFDLFSVAIPCLDLRFLYTMIFFFKLHCNSLRFQPQWCSKSLQIILCRKKKQLDKWWCSNKDRKQREHQGTQHSKPQHSWTLCKPTQHNDNRVQCVWTQNVAGDARKNSYILPSAEGNIRKK